MQPVELDKLEIVVIVDNELDPLSPYRQAPEIMTASGQMGEIITRSKLQGSERGGAKYEWRMDNICCGAHGLSLMITATRGDHKHTMLFDTGPEEEVWQRNAKRLGVDLGEIELIHLSHWHRDHSGGMLRATEMINAARPKEKQPVFVDLHPDRPSYRGAWVMEQPISLEPDPSFQEIEATGAIVCKNGGAHTSLDDMFLTSGFIPRVTDYEVGLTGGIRFVEEAKVWEKDELIQDERFVLCNVKGKGLVLFTGCSHAGVINACRHALSLTSGDIPLYAVIGGFHLVDDPSGDKVKNTVKDFVELDPTILLPGHCSGWRAKFEIERILPGRLAPCTVGTKFTF